MTEESHTTHIRLSEECRQSGRRLIFSIHSNENYLSAAAETVPDHSGAHLKAAQYSQTSAAAAQKAAASFQVLPSTDTGHFL